MTEAFEFWRKCSSCKKSILFNSSYYECSVSTCTGLRTGYVFCSVSCWEVHLPGAKHRNAGAIEKRSPTLQQFKSMPAETGPDNMNKASAEPKRILVSSGSITLSALNQSPKTSAKSSMSHEVLVVVSKMKQYIKDLSDMNTAEEVNQTLSNKIRSECEKAIENARQDGRKTVMSRDFK